MRGMVPVRFYRKNSGSLVEVQAIQRFLRIRCHHRSDKALKQNQDTLGQVVVIKSRRIECVTAPRPPNQNEEEGISQESLPGISAPKGEPTSATADTKMRSKNNSNQVTWRSARGSPTRCG